MTIYKGWTIKPFLGGFLVLDETGLAKDWMESIAKAKERINHRLSPLAA